MESVLGEAVLRIERALVLLKKRGGVGGGEG